MHPNPVIQLFTLDTAPDMGTAWHENHTASLTYPFCPGLFLSILLIPIYRQEMGKSATEIF